MIYLQDLSSSTIYCYTLIFLFVLAEKMATTKPSRLQSIPRVARRAFPHIVLITVYLGYLVLGACAFCHLEHQIQAKEFLRARNDCKSVILDKMTNMTNGNKTGKWWSLSLSVSVYLHLSLSDVIFLKHGHRPQCVVTVIVIDVFLYRHWHHHFRCHRPSSSF